jgi:iduronate 2-sulfatase
MRLPVVLTIVLAAMFGVLSSYALAAEAARPRRNVLFIATDDLNMNVGCYGDTRVKTPHLDRLAARGVRFERAYCQFPLCNPSRVSMLTGLRPDTIGVHDLQTDFRTKRRRIITLPQLFKHNGYFSARVGKIYHYGVPRQIGSGGMDDADSWDLAINPRGRDKDEEHKLHVLTRGTGSTTIGFAMAWLEMDGSDAEQTDGQATREAIGLLERFAEEDRPFFLGMGFFRPHTPFVATKKWFQKYPKDRVTLPTVPSDDRADIPDVALTIRPPNYGLSESDLKDCVRGYWASVSCLDAQVGQLLDALERLGLAENTIVVFFSDHGFLLGEHGQWQKQMLFEEANRVPLIMAGPGITGRGASPRTVELLDVYPTLVELCDLPKPRHKLEGKSLVPLLDEPHAPWNRPAYSQVERRVGRGPDARRIMGYSVRTERWRYTEWDDGELGVELYDHEKDPKEHTNLAQDDARADVVAEMKKLLMQIR